MKKTFTRFSAFLAAAVFAVAACTQVDPENEEGGNGLKPDDTEQDGGNGNTGSGNTDGDDSGLHASLQGSEYVTLALDEFTAASIADKIKAAYYVDDVNVFCYVWDGTYNAGLSSGLNFYGEAAGWTSLVVGTVGWSGAGWCITNPEFIPAFVEDAADLAKWKFHLTYKGAPNVAHCMILYWNGGEYKFAIGQGSFVDAGVTYNAINPVSGTFQPNEWNEYEVSLADTGFDYTKDNTVSKANIVAVLSGGTPGTTLDIDALFFYKK